MNIWEEYGRRYPAEDFDEDGIVDLETYRKEKIKLLFVLKETNDLESSLKDFLYEGAYGGGQKTWQPACKWAECLLDGTLTKTYAGVEERKSMLHRIATMNLKKTSGLAVSDTSYVDWARPNADLLRRQVEEINPDIILLCCDETGNYFMADTVLGGVNWVQDDKTGVWLAKWQGKTVIWARHPLFAPVEWQEKFKDLVNFDRILT